MSDIVVVEKDIIGRNGSPIVFGTIYTRKDEAWELRPIRKDIFRQNGTKPVGSYLYLKVIKWYQDQSNQWQSVKYPIYIPEKSVREFIDTFGIATNWFNANSQPYGAPPVGQPQGGGQPGGQPGNLPGGQPQYQGQQPQQGPPAYSQQPQQPPPNMPNMSGAPGGEGAWQPQQPQQPPMNTPFPVSSGNSAQPTGMPYRPDPMQGVPDLYKEDDPF